MKLMTHRFFNFIITLTITALLLTGAVPSFAWEISDDGDAKAGSPQTVLPAIEIDGSDAPKTFGTSVLVMDMDTGTVLYEKNADKVRQPASVTKILSCLVAIENLPLDKEVTVPEGIVLDGSVMGVIPGEKLTVEQLLYGLMLPSGNDAAEVLAIETAGSIDEFSKMMNARAKECGAEHTDFKNPNGLNEDENRLNYTTARDLALISREAMKNPTFRKIVGTAKYTVPETNLSEPRKLENSNFCLWDKSKVVVGGKKVPYKYEGCTGIKTGYTSDAGNCFVGSAERDGTEILVVSLNSEKLSQRYRDAIAMWDYALGKYETYHVLEAGKEAGVRRIWHGTVRTVPLATDRDLGVTIEKGTAEEQDFTTEFRFEEDRMEAPITEGQKMGEALVFNSRGRLVGVEDLYAMESVAVGGPLSAIGIADEDLPIAAGAAGGILLLIIILCISRSVRHRRRRSRQQEEILGELATMRTAGVGLTAAELSDLTGEEIIQPIPKGPARISDEELTAWASTEQRSKSERYSGSRFGGRSVKGGYGKNMPESAGGGAGAPGGQGDDRQPKNGNTPLSDEELYTMLEQAVPAEIDQPRHHGKLTEEEMKEVMGATPASESAGSAEESGDV